MVVLLLLVIFPTSDVVVDDWFFETVGFRQLLLVKICFQDRFDAFVAVRFKEQCSAAGSFHPLGRVAHYQSDDAQTGARMAGDTAVFKQ